MIRRGSFDGSGAAVLAVPTGTGQPHAGLALALAVALLAGSCRPGARSEADSGKVRVFVSIPPQAYFAERIGGEHVAVEVLLAQGQDPHTFEPTMKQMARLAGASLFIVAGMPFERRLGDKLAASHSDLRILDTRKGIELIPRAAHDHEAHAGDADHHDHRDQPDPHVWLSPRLAKLQAETICRGLADVDPAHADAYRANLRGLIADLDRLDKKIARTLAPLRGRSFYVMHPAFGYFADAYGLRQVAVEIGGKSPTLKHVEALIQRARADGVKVIFVQPQFSSKTAETIARQIGGAVVPMDPLARDYPAGLERMAASIRQALGRQPAAPGRPAGG